MRTGRIALAGIVLLAAVGTTVSGGSSEDPQTPPAIPGLPPPFLGTAVLGDGGLSAAVDSYGDIVDLRGGPVGTGLIANPAERQAAGTVPSDTGIVPRVAVGDGPPLALWQADHVSQHYLPNTNVLRTQASFGDAVVTVEDAVQGRTLARVVTVSGPAQQGAAWRASFRIEDGLDERLACRQRKLPARLVLICSPTQGQPSSATPESGSGVAIRSGSAAGIVAASIRGDRRWLDSGRPLDSRAPAWAHGMYERSLLALRALTDRRTGAAAAGVRDDWAYVWPRDAAAVSLAFAAAGYRHEARKIAAFLSGLDLNAGARFDASGTAIEGREAQGDAWGWTAAANRAAGLAPPRRLSGWRDRADYQEKSPGDYLGNALASALPHTPGDAMRIQRLFGNRGVLTREGSGSELDSTAAWAVRPFTQPALFPAARRSLQSLIRTRGGRFGIVPSEDWPEDDPWTAPTAWTAWAFAALSRNTSPAARRVADRRAALALLADLRRAAMPTGMLPERVDAQTGIPRSTTPLAWSHAFAVLALLELWPPTSAARGGF